MATLLLALSVASTGLYAGFMLIFRSGIMPALARLDDAGFVEAMRRINEEVPGVVFLVVFLGVPAFPAAALLVPVDGRDGAGTRLILAGLVCAVLNHLVTVGGNIPLNRALAGPRTGGDDPAVVRAAFERRWNGFHLVRTLLVLASFGLLTAAMAV
ncbi:DUF1772 domain-containing protein [Streptomyces sp. NBC_01216]|uniref:anthrone oxygenase family protein n=1 Tax=unclassified Streptomyces TaxID=2593676 RepID=UPI002E10F56A|nr:DUF1772 domain-containing protein [Streptomyces sp. NBC_01216]